MKDFAYPQIRPNDWIAARVSLSLLDANRFEKAIALRSECFPRAHFRESPRMRVRS